MLIKFFRWLFDYSGSFIGPKKIILHVEEIHDSEGTKLKIYRPNKDQSLPVLIFYHGGGWVIGSIKAYDRILRYLSYTSKCLIIAVEYKKAPEYKFPTAIEDSCKACSWIINNIKKLGGDIKRIGLMGDSAGGNIVTHVTANIKFKFSYTILVYPVTDVIKYTMTKSILKKQWLTKYSYLALEYCLKQYLPTKEQAILISSPKQYVKEMFLLMAEVDILVPTISKYASEMQKIGVKVKLKCYEKVLHGFLNFSRILPQGKEALDDISSFIKDINLKK
jgi:acetyl esterase